MKIKIYDITLSFVKAASLISQSRFRLILTLNANTFPKRNESVSQNRIEFKSYLCENLFSITLIQEN